MSGQWWRPWCVFPCFFVCISVQLALVQCKTISYTEYRNVDVYNVFMQRLLQTIELGCPLLWETALDPGVQTPASLKLDDEFDDEDIEHEDIFHLAKQDNNDNNDNDQPAGEGVHSPAQADMGVATTTDLELVVHPSSDPRRRQLVSTLTLGDVVVAIVSGFLGIQNTSRSAVADARTKGIITRLLRRLSRSAVLDVVGLARLVACLGSELGSQPICNLGNVLCTCLDQSPSIREATCDVVYAVSTGLSCLFQDVCGVRPVVVPYVLPLTADDPRLDLEFTTWKGPANQLPHEVVQKEMFTYYLLHKAMELLQHDTTLTQCDQPARNLTLAGWETVVNINLVADREVEPGVLQEYSLPFARTSKRRRRTARGTEVVDYMVVVRGTSNPAEWAFDFAYDMAAGPSPSGGMVRMHRGFLALAIGITAGCRPYFREAQLNNRLGRINIVGYSLGAGVCGALAMVMAAEWPYTPLEFATDQRRPRVRALLVAPPRVGTSKFNRELAAHTVLRVLMSEYDPIPYIPCQYMAGCTREKVPIPTAQNGSQATVFVYGNWRNVVAVPTVQLPPSFNPEFVSYNVLVWHICSYKCWLSMQVTPGNPLACFAPVGDLDYHDFATCPYMSQMTGAALDETLLEFIDMVSVQTNALEAGASTWTLPVDNTIDPFSVPMTSLFGPLLNAVDSTVRDGAVEAASMFAGSPLARPTTPQLLRKALTGTADRINNLRKAAAQFTH